MFILKSTHKATIARLEKIIVDSDATIEKLEGERDKAVDRLKLAAKDLAAQANEIEGLKDDVAAAEKVADARARKIADLNAEIAGLRTDAQKWRDRAAREKKRGRAKRAA